MPISTRDVERAARLAGLRIEPARRASLTAHLERLVAFADRLREVVAGTPPRPGAFSGAEAAPGTPGAPDRPAPCLPRDAALANAPQADAEGYFLAPAPRRGDGGEDDG